MMKILLDTDIGSDIDDCFALAYLLARDDVEIAGITTATAEPHMRAQLADAVCKSFGKDVAVHVGYENPLSGELRQTCLTKNQLAAANLNPKKYSKEVTGIEFMNEVIRKNPDEITLVCIGPMTNAAALFLKYPDIPALLGGMVIMGGRYADNEFCDLNKWGMTEWNCLCDMEAAKTVFDSGVKNCIVTGVEQTCRFALPSRDIKKAMKKQKRLEVVADSVSDVAPLSWFHDVVALYALLCPEEVRFQTGDISFDMADTDIKSATSFKVNPNGRYRLVTDFSPEKFIKHYADTLKIDI